MLTGKTCPTNPTIMGIPKNYKGRKNTQNNKVNITKK